MIILIAPSIIGIDNESGHNTPPQGWVGARQPQVTQYQGHPWRLYHCP
jgi:hypothetical protein